MTRPTSPPALRCVQIVAAVIISLALLLAPSAVYSAPGLMNVYVNGLRVDAYPIVREGVSYLPIQAMAQALQAEITWESSLNVVKVNGQASGATVLNQDGKIYLPIEAFVSAMGGSVAFDGKHNAIKVTTSDKMASASAGSSSTNFKGNSTQSGSRTNGQTKGNNTVTIPAVSVSPSLGGSVSGGNASGAAISTAPIAKASTAVNAPAVSGKQSSSGYSSNSTTTSGSTTPGYPVAYTPNQQQTTTSLRPADAPPFLSSNLQTGPMGAPTGNVGNGNAALPANAKRPSNGVYVPHHAQNSVFQVTVTNLETINVIKDFYHPKAGYKYVIAYLSQQNVSQQVQIYTGRFSLLDQKSVSYDYIEGLSNFWLVILRPYGINFGYLVFEIPVDSQPISLVLHALNQAPLAVNL